jgi:hypothetical protein
VITRPRSRTVRPAGAASGPPGIAGTAGATTGEGALDDDDRPGTD